MPTPDQVQTALDPTLQVAEITLACNVNATIVEYFTTGGVGYAGRCRWTQCNVADNAATQAAAILAKLAQG